MQDWVKRYIVVGGGLTVVAVIALILALMQHR
jgi:hypothetical protein